MSERPANYQVTTGHGHVTPRADGVKARCGGPAICPVCANEQAQMDAVHQERQARQTAQPCQDCAERGHTHLAGRCRVVFEEHGGLRECECTEPSTPGLRLGKLQEERLRRWPKERIRPKSAALGVISLLAEVDALRGERDHVLEALYDADEALTAVFNSHMVTGDLLMQVDRAIRRCRAAGTELPWPGEGGQ